MLILEVALLICIAFSDLLTFALSFYTFIGDPCYEEAGEIDERRTVSELNLDNCTDLETYDYFTGSEAPFALTFSAAGLWTVGRCLFCGALLTVDQKSGLPHACSGDCGVVNELFVC